MILRHLKNIEESYVHAVCHAWVPQYMENLRTIYIFVNNIWTTDIEITDYINDAPPMFHSCSGSEQDQRPSFVSLEEATYRQPNVGKPQGMRNGHNSLGYMAFIRYSTVYFIHNQYAKDYVDHGFSLKTVVINTQSKFMQLAANIKVPSSSLVTCYTQCCS